MDQQEIERCLKLDEGTLLKDHRWAIHNGEWELARQIERQLLDGKTLAEVQREESESPMQRAS